MSMKGIDISAYQSTLNFSSIKTDIIIIKATEGLTYDNPYLKLQYAKAKAIGCKVGFYHFLRANDPVGEAKHFLKAIEGLKSDCKYIIDCETNPSGAYSRVTKFAEYLKSKGKEPALYSGLSFYKDYLSKSDLPLWVAAYTKNRPLIKSIGWQYSDSIKIGGQNVDHNVFNEGILLTTSTTTKPSIYPRNGTVTASKLNVREDAGTGFKVIGQLNKGEVVRVAKNIGSDWYSIYFGSHGGYVSSQYIKLD